MIEYYIIVIINVSRTAIIYNIMMINALLTVIEYDIIIMISNVPHTAIEYNIIMMMINV